MAKPNTKTIKYLVEKNVSSFGIIVSPVLIVIGVSILIFSTSEVINNYNTNVLVQFILIFLLSVAMIFFGFYFAMSTDYVEFDIENKHYRKYSSFISKVFSKWESYEHCQSVCIQSANYSSSFASRGSSLKTKYKVYDIFLLDANKKIKLLVKRLSSKEKAESEIQFISNDLGLPIIELKQEISEATKQRLLKEKLQRQKRN